MSYLHSLLTPVCVRARVRVCVRGYGCVWVCVCARVCMYVYLYV